MNIIDSKKKMLYFIEKDLEPFNYPSFSKKILSILFKDFNYLRYSYLVHLRKLEFYSRNHKKYFFQCCYHKKRKNKLGAILNWEIPCNVFGPGLHPWHPNIVVNGDVKVGENCTLHGNNCIGRKSGDKDNNGCPIIGDNFEIGFGSCVFGSIEIKNNCVVGANSVVIKSTSCDNLLLVGSPAREIKR